MTLLQVEKISKDFVQKDGSTYNIFDNISFSIKRGECFVIIGPNGTGKTTLLRILGLLEPPNKGKIFFEEKEITNVSKAEKVKYRRKISFVRQKPVVLDTTVFNNIAFGLRVRDVDKKIINSKVSNIIDLVGLEGMEKKKARHLSGGEMQKVVIAMNFIITPEIYLLDEISANLDPQNVKLLEQFILKIKHEDEKTIIMSTHDPSEAIKFADRIGVLINGTLSQVGTPQEIFRSPKDEFTAMFIGYENIFHGQARIEQNTGLTIINLQDLDIKASIPREGEVKACIRPESIGISKHPPIETSYQNTLKGTITEIRDFGNIYHVIIISHEEKFLTTITQHSLLTLNLKIGDEVYIYFKATDVKCL